MGGLVFVPKVKVCILIGEQRSYQALEGSCFGSNANGPIFRNRLVDYPVLSEGFALIARSL